MENKCKIDIQLNVKDPASQCHSRVSHFSGQSVALGAPLKQTLSSFTHVCKFLPPLLSRGYNLHELARNYMMTS